jgi:LCP family protein required for cell wall assembly
MQSNYQPDETTLPSQRSPYATQRQAESAAKGQPSPNTRRPYQYKQPDNQPFQLTTGNSNQAALAYTGRPNEPQAQRNNIPTYQATQPVGANYGGGRRTGRPRRKRGCLIGCLGSVVVVVILFIFLFITMQNVLAFGSVISSQSPLSSQTGYMSGSQRENILIMGYGGSGHDGAYLTDSMVILSVIPATHHTTIISVPRDLWVQNPASSGNYTKLNDVYPVASNNNQNPLAGGAATVEKISLITGLTINYWVTINFTGFKNFIDAIGGVTINVPDSFTAMYPANDDPAVNASWITVKFTKGVQQMNGTRAIIYARARYVLDNPAEGSDFARSQRQQLIMQAALVKMKQWQTWPHLFDALNTLKSTLYSNLSLADLSAFALKMDLKDAHRVGLTNDNVLVDAVANDGEDILLPMNNDWSIIPPYVQKQLYN